MKTILIVTTATMLLGAPPAAAQRVVSLHADTPIAGVPRAFADQHPFAPPTVESNDSLYRAAREALNRGEYDRASELFATFIETRPGSPAVPDAYYWQAFALYRTGGLDELRRGLELLDLQRERYPDAATRDDAEVLATRIRGSLARMGDADAAVAVAMTAEQLVPRPSPHRAPSRPLPPGGSSRPLDSVSSRSGSDACADQNADLRGAAINALLNMDSERALPIVEEVLANHDECAAPLRRRAVFILAQHITPETDRILLDVIRNDPDRGVRRQAVFWLSRVPSDAAVEALVNILETDGDDSLREHALFALSQHGSDRARRILRDFAQRDDAPTKLRERAFFWISQNAGSEDAAILRSLYGRLTDDRLKERAIFAISQIGGPENQAWILGIAHDTNAPARVRKQAIFWAAQGGAPTEALIRIYDTVDEREIREYLLFALSQRADEAAIDHLIRIAQNDPSTAMRERALFWLARSNDPRVPELIRAILSGSPRS